MAKISRYQRRVFSAELKRHIVNDLELGKVTMSRVTREYDVTAGAVYKWLNKYSRHLCSKQTLVLQMDSESYKTKELEKKVQELEAALGRKQLEIDFLNKMIELGKEELGIDLKKKFSTPPSTGSDKTKGNTGTK